VLNPARTASHQKPRRGKKKCQTQTRAWRSHVSVGGAATPGRRARHHRPMIGGAGERSRRLNKCAVTSVSPYCFSTRRRGARHAHVSARGARAAAGSNGHVAPSRQQSQTERALTHVVHMAWTRCLPLAAARGARGFNAGWDSPIPLSGRAPNASETDCQDGALKRQGWLCHGGAVGRRKSQARRSKAAGSRQAGGRHGCSRCVTTRRPSSCVRPGLLALCSPSDHTHARRQRGQSADRADVELTMRVQRVRLPWRRRGGRGRGERN